MCNIGYNQLSRNQLNLSAKVSRQCGGEGCDCYVSGWKHTYNLINAVKGKAYNITPANIIIKNQITPLTFSHHAKIV